jgi:hypothetical protein
LHCEESQRQACNPSDRTHPGGDEGGQRGCGHRGNGKPEKKEERKGHKAKINHEPHTDEAEFEEDEMINDEVLFCPKRPA